MPDQNSLREQIKDFVLEQIDEAEQRIGATHNKFDQRLVSLRKECDLENLRNSIRSKADVVSVAADLENHEFKIEIMKKPHLHC